MKKDIKRDDYGNPMEYDFEGIEEASAAMNAKTEPVDKAEPIDTSIPVPELSNEALFGICGRIVKKIAPHTEAHPAALLLQLLAGLGVLLGRNSFFKAGADHHYPNLFVAVVGESSRGRKGTSLSYIRQLLRSVSLDWFQNQVINGGLASGEGIVERLKDEDEEVDEASPIKKEPKDKRLLIIESELGAALQVMSRPGNTLSAIVRNAWDSGSLNNLSKGNPGKASDCHIGIISHITRMELRELLTSNDTANGFANRFLWCYSARTRKLPEGGEDLTFSEEEAALRKVVEFARWRDWFKRSEEARAYWRSIYDELTDETTPGLWGKSTGRAEAQVLRLSLIFALTDLSETIEARHLKAAKAVWDYCFQSARWCFEDSRYSVGAVKVLEALRSGEKSRSELQRDIFKNHLSQTGWTALLRELEGVVLIKSTPTAGRSKVILSLS